MKTTMTIRSAKPRNPLVAAARFRRAGSHQLQRGGERLRARQDLHRELTRLGPHSP